jgi:hypothetical protein
LYISEATANIVSYVDFSDSKIYRFAGTTGVSGSAGDGGPALSSTMRYPTGLFYVPSLNRLYVAGTVFIYITNTTRFPYQ